jgi:hypothetical protein
MESLTTKKCNCVHKFQDEKYGNGIRVMNKMTKKEGFRCTVCGKEHTK